MQTKNKVFQVAKLILVLIVLLLIFVWIESTSRLEIFVANPGAGDIYYKISSQDGDKSLSFSSTSSRLTKRLQKGNYEVLVSQKDKNSVSMVKTSGFLHKSLVAANLLPEKQRAFVGYNAGPCKYYNSVLYGYVCGESFSSVNIHQPATDAMPTFTLKNRPTSINGALEGMVKTGEGTVALVHQIDIESQSPHIAYLLDNTLKPVKQMALNNLSDGSSYQIASYKTGFLIYDNSATKLAYYSSVGEPVENIQPTKPSDKDLKPVSVSLDQDSISIIYSSASSIAEAAPATTRYKVVVYKDGVSKTFSLKGLALTAAVGCAQDKLCVLADKSLLVFQPSDTKSNLLQKVSDVSSILPFGDETVLVRSGDVMSLDRSLSSRHIEYSFSGYSFCGSQKVDQARYLLCVGSRGQQAELIVNRGEDNKDSIDKKVLQLQKDANINTVSIYGLYIFIEPTLGTAVYSSQLNTFVPNNTTKGRVIFEINKKLDQLGIDRKGYKVDIASD